MKQSQWVFAVIILAVMVGVVTFAMTFLGPGSSSYRQQAKLEEVREITFLWKDVPFDRRSAFALEEKAPAYQDFWFFNDNTEPVSVGLTSKNCKCTAVELFLLPETSKRQLVTDAVALVSIVGTPVLQATALPVFTYQTHALPKVQKTAESPHELKQAKESVSVPGKAIGWVRLRWHSESEGRQMLNAGLWFDSKDSGKSADLKVAVQNFKALRVRPTLAMGVLQDEALGAGVTNYIICWSSTRSSLRLEARDARGGDNPDEDPFLVGKPERLSNETIRELEKENATSTEFDGRMLCAYRIPVTVRSVSQDGKKPIDIGPFQRRVVVSCPDSGDEPKQITVTGRVRGVIEIGGDGEGGAINFGPFPRLLGKRESITLQSEILDLELTFDRSRTPKFLTATVGKPEKSGARRQEWVLRVEVEPGKAFGGFPRREDPLFEDSAIYLTASFVATDKKGEKKKVSRSVRIAVSGTGNES